jgi:hypothetical protein
LENVKETLQKRSEKISAILLSAESSLKTMTAILQDIHGLLSKIESCETIDSNWRSALNTISKEIIELLCVHKAVINETTPQEIISFLSTRLEEIDNSIKAPLARVTTAENTYSINSSLDIAHQTSEERLYSQLYQVIDKANILGQRFGKIKARIEKEIQKNKKTNEDDTLEQELAKKIQASQELDKQDAMLAAAEEEKVRKTENKATDFQRITEQKKETEAQLLIKLLKTEKTNELNQAISLLTTPYLPKSISGMSFFNKTDVLPQIASISFIKPLKEILAILPLADSKHSVNIENAALLSLMAKLMEELKHYKGTAIFSAEQARKIRDVLFHYRMSIPGLKEKTQQFNNKIREMVNNIVKFMENSSLQQECQGDWEKIKPYICSPLLDAILACNMPGRDNVQSTREQLSTSQAMLSSFEALRVSGKNEISKKVLDEAIDFAYAETGALASDFKRLCRVQYNKSPHKKLYEKCIEYGKDVRHGRNPVSTTDSSVATTALAAGGGLKIN